MKNKFLLLNIIAFITVIVAFGLGFLVSNELNIEKRKAACQIGWRHAAIRYKAFDQKETVEAVKADAVKACPTWIINYAVGRIKGESK